ncbi:cebp-1 [Pristionchus pacificus]|uniref:Cebp-1 n=1 Tax=Pristionchus pacificus TaxID=54126 RepID=A0A2A6CFH1_PRIPA|nr:cebp-1 [Pristionchus pacificus]|eukprot:PDM76995.1 cebp-1 [Pristionchus pacificus]
MIFSQTMSFNSNANNYNPMYGRQESTVSMESLGNAYTEDMKAMLETPLDLNEYLFDDMDGDWPAEDQPQMDPQQPSEKQQTPQFYQEQFQMQQALYHDFSSHNNSHYGGDQFDGSEYSPNYDRPHQGMRQNMVEVKSEPDEEEFGYEKDTTPLPSTSRQMIASPIIRHRKDAAKALEEYKPQTKARGYKIKPEEVKADPTYKLKRARNNDAVRKSRTKAKEQQMEREKELSVIRERCNALEKENKILKLRLSKYEKI